MISSAVVVGVNHVSFWCKNEGLRGVTCGWTGLRGGAHFSAKGGTSFVRDIVCTGY